EAALDKYTFVREAFLQRRRSVIFDGNPPENDAPEATPNQPDSTSSPVQSDTGVPTKGPAQTLSDEVPSADQKVKP
ncbi:MAG: hypothetical protein PHS32_23645, partial [Rhodoferax sp.]|nr:hypothetical protein [Rhodoferax sp.]